MFVSIVAVGADVGMQRPPRYHVSQNQSQFKMNPLFKLAEISMITGFTLVAYVHI